MEKRGRIFDGTVREPLDAATGVAVSGGDGYELRSISQTTETFDIQPPMGPKPKHVKNYKGLKFGRLTIIGYHSTTKKHEGSGRGKAIHRWVAKCVCGRYELRRNHSIKKWLKCGDPNGIMCMKCRELERLKGNEHVTRGETK
ncbi:MAG: hypothetical protein KAR06_02485 [Deltaproteobacteria bacterium]|nr:hypothetical protein [Deltaproteobacteria bacterium]